MIAVTGSEGLIGSCLVKFLEQKQFEVKRFDLQLGFDLRIRKPDLKDCKQVYHLAADMGGIGYITTHNAENIKNNAKIDMQVAEACRLCDVARLLYTSSACAIDNLDTGYGVEKLFGERLFTAYGKDYGFDVRIARLFNVYGIKKREVEREKVVEALCRKVAEAKDGGIVEVWGDGSQVRSFLHVEDAVKGLYTLMNSNLEGPVNIGSREHLTISDLAQIIIGLSGKKLNIKYVPGAVGVQGRMYVPHSHFAWSAKTSLLEGLKKTFEAFK